MVIMVVLIAGASDNCISSGCRVVVVVVSYGGTGDEDVDDYKP